MQQLVGTQQVVGTQQFVGTQQPVETQHAAWVVDSGHEDCIFCSFSFKFVTADPQPLSNEQTEQLEKGRRKSSSRRQAPFLVNRIPR